MDIGQTNKNGQTLLKKTDAKSTTHPFAKIWEMQCTHCQHVYGSNGCDSHIRKCPQCYPNAAPGEPIENISVSKME